MTSDNTTVSIEDLYPGCSAEEVRQAEERWREYLAVVMAIHERIKNDPEAHERIRALTGREKCSTISPHRFFI